MEPKLVRVVAPHFVAGIEFARGKVTEAAPILAWAKGKTEEEMRRLFQAKGLASICYQPSNSRQSVIGVSRETTKAAQEIHPSEEHFRGDETLLAQAQAD